MSGAIILDLHTRGCCVCTTALDTRIYNHLEKHNHDGLQRLEGKSGSRSRRSSAYCLGENYSTLIMQNTMQFEKKSRSGLTDSLALLILRLLILQQTFAQRPR